MLGLSLAASLVLAGCSHSDSDDDDEENGDKNEITTTQETLSAPSEAGTITVSGAASYSGTSIVDAFASFASVSSGDILITIPAGTYEVPAGLNYNGGANIKISGTGTAQYGLDVLIKGRGKNQSTNKTRPVLEVEGSGNLVIENVAIQNVTKRSEVTETSASGSKLTQVEALGFDSSGTVAAYNCSFLSHQDTVRTISKSWFYKCYIEGDVDFIWMEAGSVAGLYENCKIYVVGDDEKTECYILAPRIDIASKVGKGNVIYNSRIIVGDGVTKAYLFRNPWSKNPNVLYNQGAVVDTKITGTIYSDVAKYDAWAPDGVDQKYVGWKVDSTIASAYPSKLSSIGTLDATTKANEYGGREAILNRLYNIDEGAFEKDKVTYWNIASVISANGWNVATDTSSSTLSNDAVTPSTQTYNFKGLSGYSNGDAVSSVDDAENGVPATLSGWKFHTATYGIYAGTGASIKIPVVAACTVKATVSYIGKTGTLTVSCNGQSKTIEGKNGNCGEVAEFTYSGSDTTSLTISISDSSSLTTYISQIEVVYNTDVSAKLTDLVEKFSKNSTYIFTTWADYQNSQQNTVIDKKKAADSGNGDALSFTNVKWHGKQYGLTGGDGAIIQVPVTAACKITVTVSYASSVHIESGGNQSQSLSNATGDLTVAVASAGTADVTIKGGTFYVSQVYVDYTGL